MHVEGPAPSQAASLTPFRIGWRAFRAGDWAHFVALPLAGFDRSLSFSQWLPALLRGAIIAALVLSWGYLINSISDRELDASSEKNPFVGGPRPAALHYGLALALPCAALAFAASASAVVLIAVLVSIASGALYSVGPRLKALPVVCTLLNVGCFAPLMLVGLVGASVPASVWGLVAAFSALLLQNQLLHEAADSDEDRDGGLRTTYALLGSRGSAAAVAFIGLGVAVAARAVAGGTIGLVLSISCVGIFAGLFPILLARDGSNPERIGRHRLLHRGVSAVSGAVLFVLAAY